MASTERIIFRAPTEWVAGLDSARGRESRSEYIRRAVDALRAGSTGHDKGGPKRKGKAKPPASDYEIPKIAKAHWKP